MEYINVQIQKFLKKNFQRNLLDFDELDITKSIKLYVEAFNLQPKKVYNFLKEIIDEEQNKK